MEKKGYLTGIIILMAIFLLPLTFSGTTIKDFQKQVSRAAYYSENYESGNSDYNYAKFLVYLYSVEEELNSYLSIAGDSQITYDELAETLGKPEYTPWVLTEDELSEIQFENPFPIWLEYLVFDGEKIQVKLNLVPYIFENQKVRHKARFIINFKEKISQGDLDLRLAEINKLAKTYALEQTIDNANLLAEKSVNFEVLADKVFQQSTAPEKTIPDLFKEENLIGEQEVVSKEYEIYNKGKKLFATLSLCEKCTGIEGMWGKIEFSMKNEKDQEIRYYFDPIPTGQYGEFGINNLKTLLIEKNSALDTQLNQQNYAQAYQITKEIEEISIILNEKINYGSESEIVNNFISMSQFYSGLLKGYDLIKTSSYKEEKYQLKIYLKEEENKTEICDNNLDDDDDSQIDCEEEFCSSQTCGQKTITSNESGQEQQTVINLYCISGMCKEKENIPQSAPVFLCGNGICEEGEADSCTTRSNDSCIKGTCYQDCGVECEAYPAIECSGKVIFKGEDEKGCMLPPICLEKNDSCLSDSDCDQPLCGKSECIIFNNQSSGTCTLTRLEQCAQPDCVDSEKKICGNSDSEIVTEICELGIWKKTRETCPETDAPSDENQIVKEKTIIAEGCTTADDCTTGVCSAGKCTTLPLVKQEDKLEIRRESTIIGKGLTGFVVDVKATGQNVVTGGFGVTGVIPNPDPTENPDALGEPDETTSVKPTIYEPARSSSPLSLTGGVRVLEGQEILIESAETNVLTSGFKGDRKLPNGIKEAFILEGKIKINKQAGQEVSVKLSSSGEIFGPISKLISRYRNEGVEWQSWKLNSVYQEDREFSNSFCSEGFARWYERFLLSNADLSTKKNLLYRLYNYNFEKKQEIATLMNGLKLKSIDYNAEELAFANYKSDFVEMICQETIKEANFPGVKRSVEIPVFSTYTTVVSYPEYFIKESYKISLSGNEFPSQSYLRKSNLGLTDKEKTRLKSNEGLKDKIKYLVSQTKDGSFDMGITIVSYADNKEEVIYGIFASLSDPDLPNSIKISPMSEKEFPTGLDARVTYDFEKVYSLLDQTEQGSWRYTGSEFDSGLNPSKQLRLIIDYIKMQAKINDVKNSMEVVTISDKEKVKDMLMDFTLNVFGEPVKPGEIKE